MPSKLACSHTFRFFDRYGAFEQESNTFVQNVVAHAHANAGNAPKLYKPISQAWVHFLVIETFHLLELHSVIADVVYDVAYTEFDGSKVGVDGLNS